MKQLCLTCSEEILKGEEVEEVTLAGGARFRHVNYEDCQRAMSRVNPRAWAKRRDRVIGHEGHVTNMPGLDDMEKW